MYAQTLPVEVKVLQDRDVVLSEVFPEEALAFRWATVFGDRLKRQGWREAPTEAA